MRALVEKKSVERSLKAFPRCSFQHPSCPPFRSRSRSTVPRERPARHRTIGAGGNGLARCNRVEEEEIPLVARMKKRTISKSSFSTDHSPCSPAACPWVWALLCFRASACLRSGCPGREDRPGRAWGTRQRPWFLEVFFLFFFRAGNRTEASVEIEEREQRARVVPSLLRSDVLGFRAGEKASPRKARERERAGSKRRGATVRKRERACCGKKGGGGGLDVEGVQKARGTRVKKRGRRNQNSLSAREGERARRSSRPNRPSLAHSPGNSCAPPFSESKQTLRGCPVARQRGHRKHVRRRKRPRRGRRWRPTPSSTSRPR